MTTLSPMSLAVGYDRSALKPGIVHIGVGRFHRAHLAVYLDDLLCRGEGQEWAIRGVGLRPEDAETRDALWAQQGLYSVTEKHPDGHRSTRVVGSVVEFVDGFSDPQAAIEAVAEHMREARARLNVGTRTELVVSLLVASELCDAYAGRGARAPRGSLICPGDAPPQAARRC